MTRLDTYMLHNQYIGVYMSDRPHTLLQPNTGRESVNKHLFKNLMNAFVIKFIPVFLSFQSVSIQLKIQIAWS